MDSVTTGLKGAVCAEHIPETAHINVVGAVIRDDIVSNRIPLRHSTAKFDPSLLT